MQIAHCALLRAAFFFDFFVSVRTYLVKQTYESDVHSIALLG